jgi:hypothetical protein
MKNFFIFIAVLGIGVGIGWLVSSHDSRPCVAQERQIMKNYDLSKQPHNPNDLVQRLIVATMYSELAEKGCPENQADWREKADRELSAIRSVASMEVNVDMKGVAEAANAVNAATTAASEALGKFLDRVKDTKINITVE